MNDRSQFNPAAVILITGISASGKTTLSKALEQRLNDYGIQRVVRIDGEDLRAQLSREYGHDLAERSAVLDEIIALAETELKKENVVIVSTTAHTREGRLRARRKLNPFYEVFLDCPVEVCADRDKKGHYARAQAGEYECFIGVTHAYEPSSAAELTLHTATTPLAGCADRLARGAIEFLNTPERQIWRRSWRNALLWSLAEWLVNSRLLKSSRIREGALKDAKGREPIASIQRKFCSQLFLLFGDMGSFAGNRGVVGAMEPMRFFKHSGLFGRNLTWIRDPYLEDFTKGVSEEISTEQELTEWILSYRASLPHVTHTYALGSSSGCYGALLYGHHLGLEEVWAFSPRTVHADGDAPRARLRDILSNHNGITTYHIWYAPNNRMDRQFSELLEPCPGVILHPCPEFGKTHFVMRELTQNNVLKNIFPPYAASTVRTDATDSATGSPNQAGTPTNETVSSI